MTGGGPLWGVLVCLVVETAVVAVLQPQPKLEQIEERVYCLEEGTTRLIRRGFWRFEGVRLIPKLGEGGTPLYPEQVEWTGPSLSGPTASP